MNWVARPRGANPCSLGLEAAQYLPSSPFCVTSTYSSSEILPKVLWNLVPKSGASRDDLWQGRGSRAVDRRQ